MAVPIPLRFDHDFIERRLREHRVFQWKLYEESVRVAVCEVVIALKASRQFDRSRRMTARKDERREPYRGPHPSI
ncbi:MAG TPA: hypothetical protein VJX23_03085 [Candidatus Binataceae bacterium]|nr:hypothetical protein [Candidatus Binataceae bacterium]